MGCKPRKVIMSFKTSPDQQIFKYLPIPEPIKVGSLNVNLKNASVGFVMIDFFSNIDHYGEFGFSTGIGTPETNLQLDFHLHKKVYNGEDEELKTWTYRRRVKIDLSPVPPHVVATVETEDTFNFRFCDFNPCCECCCYYVTIEIRNPEGVEQMMTKIKNISMSAIAQ